MANQTNKPSEFMNRRRFLQMTGLASGAAFLAACAPAEAPSPADDEAAAPSEDAAVVSWWTGWSTATTQVAIPQIIEAFEEEYPDIHVDWEPGGGPPGGGELVEVLLARIAAGNPPNSATIADTPAQYAARGSLTQLDDFMENAPYATHDAFYEGPLNSCRWQGGVYGLPASAGAGCIVYNVEIFEEAGLPTDRDSFPTTWDGLKDLSAQLTDWNNGEPQQLGLVPWAAGWLQPVWSELNGGRLFDADSLQYTLDTPENVDWLNYWLTWLDEQFHGDVEQLNFYGPHGDYPPSSFYDGMSAMVQTGSWAPVDAEYPFEWEVAKFPVGPNGDRSVTGFWPNWFIVPAGASNLQESFTFNEFFCTRGWEIWYRYIVDTPAWVDFPEDVLTDQLVDAVGIERATEYHAFFADYLTDAIDMWNSPIENFANDTLTSAVNEVLFKQTTADQALATAQELIQSRLDEALQS